MARPREFDEEAALTTAIGCFWARGYEALFYESVAVGYLDIPNIGSGTLKTVCREPFWRENSD